VAGPRLRTTASDMFSPVGRRAEGARESPKTLMTSRLACQ